jgi:hypothetical protein
MLKHNLRVEEGVLQVRGVFALVNAAVKSHRTDQTTPSLLTGV